jgi:hypothetical protein
MTLFTGNTTSNGPSTPAGFANDLENNVNYGIDVPSYITIPTKDSVYTGSLSSHGSMVAMSLNPGEYNYLQSGADSEGQPVYVIIPFLTGYLREYWRNPKSCKFGSNSAIPAITAVMPDRFTETPGNALFYIDLQMTRITGSNYFDNYYFVNTFNQLLGWLTTANNYLIAVNTSDKRNLQYFGATSYADLTTQGFNKYAQGQALKGAISNIGTLIQEIPTGQFGTSNSVAKHLVDSGLGAIGNLSVKIQSAGINYSDILNPIYTALISEILSTINNPSDLSIIQTVIKTSVTKLTSALDYTSIEVCSGRPNDSAFSSFVEFGKDIFQKTPNFAVTTGKELADVIDTVLNQTTSSVESLATKNTLLPKEIIDNFRSFLPKTPTGQPASLLNVIGCASGYLLDYLNAVNEGLNTLSKSPYGSQIHNALASILDTYEQYKQAYADSVNNIGEGGSPPAVNPVFSRNIETKKSEYFSLLNTIANDPAYKNLVQSINLNWDLLCEGLNTEVFNYNKANVTISSFNDNTVIYSFVSSLPGYAADSQGLGTDFFLYSMCQPNQAGDAIKSFMNQVKNSEILSNIGVQIRGVI